MRIDVAPVDAARFHDAQAVLGRAAGACWCAYYRMSAADYGRHRADELAAEVERRTALLRERCAEQPAPGMVAAIDGEPVGWCGLGSRSDFPRLQRSRTIPPPEDPATWAVVCFVVRSGFRRIGVARALLEGATDYARRCGAPAIEGYPVDPGAKRIDAPSAYVGTTGMFERVGYRRVCCTGATSARCPRWVLRLDL